MFTEEKYINRFLEPSVHYFSCHYLLPYIFADAPISQISLVEPKEPRLLREDENAELLCSADASPPAYNFTFYKGTEVRVILEN